MQKGNQTNPSHSPTITPQSTHIKSKSISSHKPPTHNKKSQIDQKPQNSIKRPKHRTNSFTPKPAKLNIFDRGFHNVNLSDTDVSSKYIDLTYTNTKLKSSLYNKLDLTAKAKDVKKPKNIDKIIKKSLIKAKNIKISQERVSKETKIEKEIKKNEISLQNKQIRIQNLLRYKRKKKGRKKQLQREKGRSESVIKVRKNQFLNELEGKKKRSVSSVDYYQSVERRSDPEILEIIEQQSNKRRIEDRLNYLDRVSAEFSKSRQAEKAKKCIKVQKNYNEAKADNGRNKGLENFDNEVKVERNISFIEEVSDTGLFSMHSSKNDIDIGSILNEFDHKGKTESILRNAAACVIQKFFRKKLIHKYLNKKKKQAFGLFNEQTSIIPKKKVLHLVKNIESLQILQKPRVLHTQNIEIISYIPTTKSLNICKSGSIIIKPLKIFLNTQKQSALSIKPSPEKNKEILRQLQEQVATNLAQINIIKQLKENAINLIESLTKDLKNSEAVVNSVLHTYKSLLSAMKKHSKSTQKEFLDSLTVKEFAKLKKSQQELEDSFRALLGPEKSISLLLNNVNANEIEFPPLVSSDLSSDEIESLGGISHSHSLSQLLNEPFQSSSGASLNSEMKFSPFFNIDDQIEVQNLNFMAGELKENSNKDLPSLPAFSFSGTNQFSVDLPNSEVRILTSSDSIIDFAQEILKKIDFSFLQSTLSTPLKKNPLQVLEKLNTLPIGSLTEHNKTEFPQVLDPDLLLKSDQNESELDSTVREISKSDFIHKKMIILTINSLLQEIRPYGIKGEPLLWERNRAVPRKKWTGEEIKAKILKDLQIFSSFQIGRIFSEEIINLSGGIDEEIIECLREEKLEKAILYEILVEDNEWVCYEFEEMQIVLDLADLIMEVLADEMVDLCNSID